MPQSASLVHETSTSVGTGNLTLVNVNGKQPFNTAFGNGVTTNVFVYFISNQNAAEWERGEGHLSAASTLVRDTVLESSNSNAAVNFSAGTKDVVGDVPAGRQGGHHWHLKNGKIVESHASSAATFAVKTLRGNDPSPKEPVTVDFMDGTERAITAALSITVSSGSTAGASSGVPFRLWFSIIDDGGVTRLGVRNCSDANGVYGFPGHGVLSSTAEGGAGAADSAGVTYTDTAVTSKQFVIVGSADYEAGLTTAGTWAAAPTRIPLFAAGMAKPGDAIQHVFAATVTNFSTASATYVVSSTTLAIVLSSPINLVEAMAAGPGDNVTASRVLSARMSRGTTNNTNIFGSAGISFDSVNRIISTVTCLGVDKPGVAGSTTYAVQILDGASAGVNWGANGNVCCISLKELVG